ncbi:MAG TPA: DUF1569 domain-containing protein [Bryobacteraceae bacterium]
MKNLGDGDVLQSIEKRIARLHPGVRAVWGRMSAHQMICHLSDSFRAGLGEKWVSPASGPAQRTLVKWFALYIPLPWPKGVPTRPEVDQLSGGTPPVDFEKDRAGLLAVLGRFCDPRQRFYGRSHPIFGPMDAAEWLRWGWLHADHHLRQFGM